MTAALAWLWASKRERNATILASVAALCGAIVTNGSLAEGHILGELLAVIVTLLISAIMVIICGNRKISMLAACFGLDLLLFTIGTRMVSATRSALGWPLRRSHRCQPALVASL